MPLIQNLTAVQVIDAESVDFWSKDLDDLILEIEIFAYPPSFRAEVISQHAIASVFLNLQFSLNSGKPQDFTVNIPLMSSQKCEG